MLIPLKPILQKYGINVHGCAHVGSHWGQEYEAYKECGIDKILFIEPSNDTFRILSDRFKHYPDVILAKEAAGSYYGVATMNIEFDNQGQSSSILKPKLHLTQHPNVRFNGDTEVVSIDTLDNIIRKKKLSFDDFNMLMVDTQGFEMEVLKGAPETLKHTELVYAEINRDETYECNPLVEDLDDFLLPYGFIRTETKWASENLSWGDAVWVKQNMRTKIIVPNEFQLKINTTYPPNNFEILEEWFSKQELPETERAYLPVFWTSYFVNHDYGNDERAVLKLQKYIDSLPRDKKYYTIVQYDDCCIIDFKDLDIIVFGMSKRLPEQRIDYILPLMGMPQPYRLYPTRDIFANCIMNITHPIREKILAVLKPLNEYYVTVNKHSIEDYCMVIARSLFTLCPRGYGMPSFRVTEALQYGSIPVYISDYFLVPHNLFFSDYGVLIAENEIDRIDQILHDIPIGEIKRKQENGKRIYQEYYTYESNKQLIINHLSNER